jgi:DNA polymerase-3 subunit epsilon
MLDSSDTWIALDFETATSSRASACALGVAVIQDGAVVSSGAWLIQPPGNQYDPMNIHVHGIHPSHTAAAPTYDALYPELAPFIERRNVVAHYAPFDVSVLRAMHDHYRIPLPETEYTCSCQMAQRAFPALPNHKLPTVCAHCAIPLEHHDATSDALACAEVALRCRDEVGAATIHETVRTLGVRLRQL